MVVCQVVHVRNLSQRNFRIVTDDPFYSSPTLNGGATDEDSFEIPPHLDAAAEGLVVPWSSTTFHGLIILEVDSGQLMRCSVGPKESDAGRDWLRLHDSDWAPIAEDDWLELGPRHWFGAIGNSVQLQLTFQEPTWASSEGHSLEELSSADALAACVSFMSEVDSASPSTVFLNVYDLAPVTSAVNSLLCNTVVKTFGAFHAAIEVYGAEWGFYRQQDPELCGVCRSRQPRHHPVHVYRQSVNLGQTQLTEAQTIHMMKTEIARAWPGGRYDLIHCNCIHFCEELAKRLGAQPVPSWVRGLHETGAAAASVFRTFSQLNVLNLVTTPPAVADSPSREEALAPQIEVIIKTEAPGLPEVSNTEKLPSAMTIQELRGILPVLLNLDVTPEDLQVKAAGRKLEDTDLLGKLFDHNGGLLRLSLRKIQFAAAEEAEAAKAELVEASSSSSGNRASRGAPGTVHKAVS